MPKKTRSRGWCFTWNNYIEADILYLKTNPICKYLIYGNEKGKQGTPHLQGYVHYATLKSFAQVREHFKNNHVEIAKWQDASIKYCQKDGNYTERGEKPLTQKEKGVKGKEYWEEQLKLIKSGDHDKIDPRLQITHCRNIDYIYNKYLSKKKLSDTTEQNWWYVGPTGTGKSRAAREKSGNDFYPKMCNKWWEHYKEENYVIIDDIDKRHSVLCHHLKIWGDRYPFLAEIKNGARKIRPQVIIVTSNYHPKEIWPDEEDHQPILRRYKIKYFL